MKSVFAQFTLPIQATNRYRHTECDMLLLKQSILHTLLWHFSCSHSSEVKSEIIAAIAGFWGPAHLVLMVAGHQQQEMCLL